MPRWVKVVLAAVVAVLLLLAVLMLIAPGEHGPGRHLSHVTTSGALNHGLTPSAGRA